MNIAENRTVDADWAAIAVVVFGVTAFSVSQGLTYPLISLVLAERSVGQVLWRLGFRRLVARPRHPGQDAAAQASFSQTSPPL